MQALSKRDYLFTIISAVIYSIAMLYVVSWLSFIFLIPTFIAMYQKSIKQVALLGGLFGIISGGILFFWMNQGVMEYSGNDWSKGAIIYVLSILVNTIYFFILFIGYGWISKLIIERPIYKPIWSLVTASWWTVVEIGHYSIFKTLPFLFVYPSLTSFDNTIWIQNATFGGMHLLTFGVVLLNHLFFLAVLHMRAKQYWIIALTTMLGFHILGLWSLLHFEKNSSKGDAVNVVIVNENHPPGTQWNVSTGDKLVQSILANNKKAQTYNPDIILWSESLVPWTYESDDDFIQALGDATPQQVLHVLGMPTSYQDNLIYNSTYAIDYHTNNIQRYDKIDLIPMAERPAAFMTLPFVGQEDYHCAPGDKGQPPFLSKYGKIGIVICNESNIWQNARQMALAGANFFLVPGNDAWFFNFPLIVNQHFYSCRIRAIETRKDFGINLNMGISGHIAANGDIIKKFQTDKAFINSISIYTNNYISFFTKFPNLILNLSIFFILMFLVILFFMKRK